MLCLQLHTGMEIQIGEAKALFYRRGNRLYLGIDAPKHVPIVRSNAHVREPKKQHRTEEK